MRRRLLNLVHRQIWQRLPRKLRRQALFGTARMLSPRPSPNFDEAGPIIVAGAFSTASGLGESARLSHDALVDAEFDTYGIDLTGELMQPTDHEFLEFRDGRGLVGPGTLVLHVNPPMMGMALRGLGAEMVRGKRIVGYWAWELPDLAPDWRPDMPMVHEIWTTSRFTADAIRQGTSKPIYVVAHPIAVRETAVRQAQSKGPFTAMVIFNMASSMARKNPLAAVHAFKQAFDGDRDARLVIKVSNSGAFPAGRQQLSEAVGGAANIDIIDRLAGGGEMDRLFAAADVVMSLHRSEGFGLVVAEAMLRGIPVIATDWSGSVDFFDSRFGFPIPVTLVSAIDPQATYHFPDSVWADADVAEAAAALIRLRDNRELGVALGAAGREFAMQAFGVNAYRRTVDLALGRASRS